MMKDLEARGVEPLFPASMCSNVRGMLYQSHFRGERVFVDKRGRTRMLLILLLPWQAYGNIRNRNIGPLVSVIRTVGSSSHCAFHSLRRTATTLLYEVGIPSGVAQALIR